MNRLWYWAKSGAWEPFLQNITYPERCGICRRPFLQWSKFKDRLPIAVFGHIYGKLFFEAEAIGMVSLRHGGQSIAIVGSESRCIIHICEYHGDGVIVQDCMTAQDVTLKAELPYLDRLLHELLYWALTVLRFIWLSVKHAILLLHFFRHPIVYWKNRNLFKDKEAR